MCRINAFMWLVDNGLVDCATIRFGYNSGWISRDGVSDYFTDMVCSDGFDGCDLALLLAVSSSLSDVEFNDIVAKLPGGDEFLVINRWRLGRLMELDLSDITDDEKLCILQDIYAEFDYPEDMAGCSIYSLTSEPPLEAMRRVISDLSVSVLG